MDTWFTDENKKTDFKMICVLKNVRIPKILNLEWFSKQGFKFSNWFKAHGLSTWVQMKGTFYLELVMVFYKCVRANMEGNLYSTANGVEIIIDATIWKVVVGLDMGGVHKFEESMDGYNKMETYRGMLLDPTRILRNRLGIGGLTAEDRMLVYLIAYILVPRSKKHKDSRRSGKHLMLPSSINFSRNTRSSTSLRERTRTPSSPLSTKKPSSLDNNTLVLSI